ncbi:hypothetical protein L1049_004144 [Liquidambar formosana]|uniref:Beta-carotene isomerase D27-like C-terminal domain-containing protein n=1 Tax=Liquidambar formosana TaxID=63359 RepID=A0AAP0RP01_LIQFO
MYTGLRNSKSGYESLVEAARVVSRNFNPIQQRELVIQALDKAFPRPILSLARQIQDVTTKFEICKGILCRLHNLVFSLASRTLFLQESNCVGMCSNLCMIPSQTFIKDSLGMPLNMVPNFDDMSCEMISSKLHSLAQHGKVHTRLPTRLNDRSHVGSKRGKAKPKSTVLTARANAEGWEKSGNFLEAKARCCWVRDFTPEMWSLYTMPVVVFAQ